MYICGENIKASIYNFTLDVYLGPSKHKSKVLKRIQVLFEITFVQTLFILNQSSNYHRKCYFTYNS